MNSYFIYSEEGSNFEYDPDHPFRPERSLMMKDLLEKYELLNEPWIEVVPPEPIPRELLLLFHSEKYLKTLEAAGKGEVTEDTLMAGLGTNDNPIFKDMFEKSNLAAGGTLVGTRLVLEAEGKAFAFNPIGGFHHAYPDYAEGFCYINDIAIVGKMLRRDGLRFAYIDVDAHHGNGVETAFYDDDGALVISIHQSGKTLYPGTGFEDSFGEGAGEGYNINVPLLPHTDDDLYLKAFYEVVTPAVETFSPDVVLFEMGTDTMYNDPLTSLALTNNSFEAIALEVGRLSEKLIGMGGGGYNVDSTSRAWAVAWAAINGFEMENPYAGIVGGMMSGPELEGGTLLDNPRYITGPLRDKNKEELDRVLKYIKENVFPKLGVKG
jgi:acetoin utilization protein AcuC